MEYAHIKKHLGETWLCGQLKTLLKKNWATEEVSQEIININIISSFFRKLDTLLAKLENVENFSLWVNEARTSKNFDECLFELMVLETLMLKTEELKIKPVNPLNNSVPEAIIKKDGVTLFIEATKKDLLEGSYNNVVEKLFGKSRKKFSGAQGLHFVGVFNLFVFDGEKEFFSENFARLARRIQMRFKFRGNEQTQAVILTNIFLVYNPELKDIFIQKQFVIINKPEDKGGLPLTFLENILDVNETKYY